MKKFIVILGFSALCSLSPLQAQLYPPNEVGVTQSVWHTIVRDVETTTKFWALFGGTPTKIDGIDVIKLPGVFIFMHRGEPSGPSRGAVIDHVGVNCTDCSSLIKRLLDAGVRTNPINPVTLRGPNWKPGDMQRAWTNAYSPDGLTVEIALNPCTFGSSHPNVEPCPERIVEAAQKSGPSALIGSDLIHLYLKSDIEVKLLYDFYTKFFGGKIVRASNVNLVIPGVKFNIVISAEGPRPGNRGRALDSIGFEVKNLEAFCKKLEAAGVKFNQPYSKSRQASFASAEFTDAWGTPVQLTEGLNRYVSTTVRQVPEAPRMNPVQAAAKGKQLFEIHCTYCHSADSNVAIDDAPGLKGLFNWPPHKLADGTEHNKHTQEMLGKVIVLGTKRMPARGIILSDQEMKDLLVYLQTI